MKTVPEIILRKLLIAMDFDEVADYDAALIRANSSADIAYTFIIDVLELRVDFFDVVYMVNNPEYLSERMTDRDIAESYNDWLQAILIYTLVANMDFPTLLKDCIQYYSGRYSAACEDSLNARAELARLKADAQGQA